jgi:hypothetical protein
MERQAMTAISKDEETSVAEFLHETGRGRVLYLGCSNGSWSPFCTEQGFGGHALLRTTTLTSW